MGLEVAPLTDVAITSVLVTCPRYQSVPPGVAFDSGMVEIV